MSKRATAVETAQEKADLTEEAVWQALEEVKDPEIPVVSVVEMGIVRDVAVDDGRVAVKMTPTFSGCPALHVMEREIEQKVWELGAEAVEVETVLYPPWTTDWITDEARQKLKEFGLSPPQKHGGNVAVTFYEPAACPYCDSKNTTVKNTFGPTLCRAIYYCNDCQEPFEQFKAL
ncbi:MAG: 1,2-phenylacetyl-CoA epoxidase subunit PaaD [Candidatus Promineifilaceae bacterium]|nr:1,2-phenylacetyl-CoA epoxidase subunit PaaD [Candidatus Promineifilaceae bacterium]